MTSTGPDEEPNPLIALFRQCVVRIDDDTGRFRGTGFFAAPGRILTCAHVIHGARGLAAHWLDRTAPAEVVAAVPLLASVADPESYPLPDLAVLDIEQARDWDHPCACLAVGRPMLGEALYLAGYTIEHGSSPALTGATTEFESKVSEDGHDFYKLKRGQILHGFSGSPLLNLRTGLIAGITESSRGRHSDLGGFAVLADEDALAAAFPDLVEQNRQFRGSDRRWAGAAEAERTQADDRAGKRGRLPLGRPMVRLVPGDDVSPATLLRPRHAVVRYVGREKLLADVAAWCETDQPEPGPQLWFVTGTGGFGKSRLAVEACSEAETRKWTAGLLRPSVSEAQLQALAEWRGRLLIAIDYAETRPAIVSRLVEELVAHEPRPSARIMLLVRRPVTRTELLALFNEQRDEEFAALLRRARLSALDDAPAEVDRLGLFYQAVQDLSVTSSSPRSSPRRPQLRAAHFARPLYILVAALLARASPVTDVDALGEDDLLRELLSDHEASYWDRWAKRRNLSLDAEDQRAAVAVATLLTARSDSEALTVARLIPHHDGEPQSRLIAIARWLGQLYAGEGQPGQVSIGPLEPDRLGEVLIADVLRQYPDLLAAAIDAASDEQLTHVLTVIARIASDDEEVRSQLQACLDIRFSDLFDRASRRSQMFVALLSAAGIARVGALHSAMDTLSERQAAMMSMRWGMADGQQKTLDEVSKAYGVTRERIRQIESSTLSQLRHPSRRAWIRRDLD